MDVNNAYRRIKAHSSHFKSLSAFLDLLKETISSFLGARVEFIHNPKQDFMNDYQIGIMQKTSRGFYPLDKRNVLILARIFNKKELISALGLKISGIDVEKSSKLLNLLENYLTRCFTEEFPKFFSDCHQKFGDDLLKNLISEYVAKGGYRPKTIKHLLEYFFKLRTTSFEGKYFSTGAIISKSSDLFDNTIKGKRFGSSDKLKKPFSIKYTNKLDKRIWYLVDGKTSFFLGSKELTFRNLFTLDDLYSNENFLDLHSLSLTLKGGDFLIKVENEKLLSIITSDGSEFMFFENKWKYRNYGVLKDVLIEHFNGNEDLLNSILFYVLTCSKNQISTILWFPEDFNQIDKCVIPDTKNNFLSAPINISDKKYVNHLFRCFSSDGVSIIDREGYVQYIGVIVDIRDANVQGIAGTGETAASVLAQNGLSIKISSDGLIKIFPGKNDSLHF